MKCDTCVHRKEEEITFARPSGQIPLRRYTYICDVDGAELSVYPAERGEVMHCNEYKKKERKYHE